MSKIFAFLAYLLNIVGALYVLIVRRKDEFAIYHAKQSLGMTILALAVFIGWVVVGWIILWVPYVGAVLAAGLFALVIAAYIVLAISYLSGMMYALDAKMKPVPIVGGLATRLSSMIFNEARQN